MRFTLSSRLNRGGYCFAGTYVVLVVVVFALTAVTTEAGKAGLDWMPFVMLAMPWFRLNERLLVPGLIANAAFMYLLGTVLHNIWRDIRDWG